MIISWTVGSCIGPDSESVSLPYLVPVHSSYTIERFHVDTKDGHRRQRWCSQFRYLGLAAARPQCIGSFQYLPASLFCMCYAKHWKDLLHSTIKDQWFMAQRTSKNSTRKDCKVRELYQNSSNYLFFVLSKFETFSVWKIGAVHLGAEPSAVLGKSNPGSQPVAFSRSSAGVAQPQAVNRRDDVLFDMCCKYYLHNISYIMIYDTLYTY